MMTLGELLEGEDAARLAQARAEIAAEKAAWDALSPEEREAKTAAFEAKYETMFEASLEDEDDEEDLEDEE